MRSATRKRLGKDKAYLEFIASLPCVVCLGIDENTIAAIRDAVENWTPLEQHSRTEVAHVGERGLSQKSPDRETIPLCAEHHRTGSIAHHALGRRFWERHNIDRDRLITALNETYERRKTQ